MKLLFDENVSYRIIKKVNHVFPDSKHVSEFSKFPLKDRQIFEIAKSQGFSIVTFDEDFFNYRC